MTAQFGRDFAGIELLPLKLRVGHRPRVSDNAVANAIEALDQITVGSTLNASGVNYDVWGIRTGVVKLFNVIAMIELRCLLTLGLLLAPALAQAQDVVVFFHTDAIGSVRVVTDANGAVIARYDYLSFGERWDPQPNPDARQFAGGERDAETGFDYFGARYYRPQSGMFTTVDPGHVNGDVLDPQSWNGYAYARNNPLKFVDPTGTTYEICGYSLDGFSTCGSVSDQYFAVLQRNPGAGLRLWGGTIFAGDRAVGSYRQTSVDATFADFARSTGELSCRWLREQSTQMAVGASIAATGGLAAGVFSGGLAATEVLGIGRIAAGVTPLSGQIAQMQQVFARQGRAGVEKALRSLERRLSEHISKIDAARSGSGYTSSMEREVRNFRQLIAAAKQILGR